MIKRGTLQRIKNLDPKRSANEIYFRVLVPRDAPLRNSLSALVCTYELSKTPCVG